MMDSEEAKHKNYSKSCQSPGILSVIIICEGNEVFKKETGPYATKTLRRLKKFANSSRNF